MITTPQNLASKKKKPKASATKIVAQAPLIRTSLAFLITRPNTSAQRIHNGIKKGVVVVRSDF